MYGHISLKIFYGENFVKYICGGSKIVVCKQIYFESIWMGYIKVNFILYENTWWRLKWSWIVTNSYLVFKTFTSASITQSRYEL